LRTAFLALGLAVTAIIGVTAGCAVGPDYKRPRIEAPAVFMGQQAIDGRPATQSVELAIWWQGYQDPLMTRFIERALTQNLSLAQAQARLAQAKAAYRGAWAALLPRGDLQAEGARARQSLQTPLGQLLNATPNYDRDSNYYEGDVTASWEVDVFGGLRRGKEAAKAQYEASQAGVVATRLAIAAQTADVYITIRGIQARLNIAHDQVDTRQHLLNTIRQQFDRGVAARLQVEQADGALAQAAATIPVLETSLESALNAMDIILGAQPGTYRAELEPPAPIPTAPRLANTGTPADLIQRRPDLMVAERELAAANARIGAAISDYYPKFSLGALIGTATTGSRDVFTNGATQALGVAGLRWRLFDFGRVSAEIAAAKGRDAEALAAYQLSVLKASEDVENSFSALVKYEVEAQTLVQGEASLTRARDLSMIAYQRGVISLIEVLYADSALLAASDARARAQADAASAAAASFLALGGGWDVSPNAGPDDRRVAKMAR
jgi:NodT family efflux transporter outer membrane factor (OMF) lipoprotein